MGSESVILVASVVCLGVMEDPAVQGRLQCCYGWEISLSSCSASSSSCQSTNTKHYHTAFTNLTNSHSYSYYHIISMTFIPQIAKLCGLPVTIYEDVRSSKLILQQNRLMEREPFALVKSFMVKVKRSTTIINGYMVMLNYNKSHLLVI